MILRTLSRLEVPNRGVVTPAAVERSEPAAAPPAAADASEFPASVIIQLFPIRKIWRPEDKFCKRFARAFGLLSWRMFSILFGDESSAFERGLIVVRSLVGALRQFNFLSWYLFPGN